LRYGEKLKIESEISVRNAAIKVAPLILLPFAENCFKHGGVGSDGLFRINIHLLADDKKLVFHLTNSKKKNREKTAVNGGVGLENIRKRLTLLYPDRHQLSIDNQPDQYSVRLEINFRDEDI